MPTKAEKSAYQPRTNTSDPSCWLVKKFTRMESMWKGVWTNLSTWSQNGFFNKKTSKTTFRPHLRPCFFWVSKPETLVALQKQKCLPRRFSETPLIWWTCWSFRRQIVSDELKYGVPFQGGRKHLPPDRKAGKIIGLDSKKCLFESRGYVIGSSWAWVQQDMQECPNVPSFCCDNGSLHIDPLSTSEMDDGRLLEDKK